jgi:hypothetical protein
MRNLATSIACALSFLVLLDGCKKAEQPAASEATTVKKSAVPATAKATSPQAPESAGKGVLLRVKWPVGNRYVYRMDMDQHVTNRVPQLPKPIVQDVTIAITYALSVTKELPDNGREVEMAFLANEMEVKMGEQTIISFDSKEPGKNDAQNAVSEPFRKMIGTKVAIQLTSNGRVDKIVGLEEWQKALGGDQPGPGMGMLAQQFGEGFFRQIMDAGRAFPDKLVEIGESWPFEMDTPAGPLGKVSVKATVTFKDWEDRQQHKCVALLTSGSFKGSGALSAGPMGKMSVEDGKASGTSWFDPELGALIESESSQRMHIKGEASAGPAGGNRPPMAFTIDIGQKVNLNLVELGKIQQ